MTYKIINGNVILEPNLLPKVKKSRPLRECNFANVGIDNQLLEPSSELHVTKRTFFYSVPMIWNQTVTPKQAQAPCTDAFKNHFKKML